MSNEDELNLWLEVTGGKNKKGRIYGFRSEDEHIGSSAIPPSVNSTVDPEMQTEMSQMKEVASLKQKTDMIMSALQALGIHLPNQSNLVANDEAPPATKSNEDIENDS